MWPTKATERKGAGRDARSRGNEKENWIVIRRCLSLFSVPLIC